MTPAALLDAARASWADQDRSLWPATEESWHLFSLGYIEGIRFGAKLALDEVASYFPEVPHA